MESENKAEKWKTFQGKKAQNWLQLFQFDSSQYFRYVQNFGAMSTLLGDTLGNSKISRQYLAAFAFSTELPERKVHIAFASRCILSTSRDTEFLNNAKIVDSRGI